MKQLKLEVIFENDEVFTVKYFSRKDFQEKEVEVPFEYSAKVHNIIEEEYEAEKHIASLFDYMRIKEE